MLVSKDVKSLIEVRSSLREFLRSESLSIIREITEKTTEQKLFVLDFLVRSFALVGDIQVLQLFVFVIQFAPFPSIEYNLFCNCLNV